MVRASGICPEGPGFNPWSGYESFDLSKTHSLSTQDLVKIFIHSFIHEDDSRRKFLKEEKWPKNFQKIQNKIK